MMSAPDNRFDRIAVKYIGDRRLVVIEQLTALPRQGNHIGQALLGAQPGPWRRRHRRRPRRLDARGVDVSEIFHYAGGPFKNAVENPRGGGRDPQGRSYFSFASFEDPDWSWLHIEDAA
jgi:hypothetical protein